MDWVKLWTNLDGHPKILAAGLAGAGLYARALAYCGRYETDGDVPMAWVENAEANTKQVLDLAEALASVGLWERTDTGFRIRDFTEVNFSRAEMQRLRKARSKAGKKGGKQKPSKHPSKRLSKSQANAKQDESYSSSSSLRVVGKEASGAKGGLANLLAELVTRNGSRAPTVTREWLEAERLLLERDGRPPAEAEALIRWCQEDDFWKSNILSLPKFRKQYDQLRLKAEAEQKRRSPGMEQARRFAEEAERKEGT